MTEKISNSCEGNGWHEVPNTGDDATYPRDWYSDSWDRGNEYARGKAIVDWLNSMGFSVSGHPHRTIPFCNENSCTGNKKCLPQVIESDPNDTVTIKLVSVTMPGNKVKEMYWAFAKDRGRIKLRATSCKCVSVPQEF